MGERKLVANDLLHWFRRSADMPVVLLHGFTGSAASWTSVADAMTAPCVVALHLPGHHRDAPVADTWLGNIDWVAATLIGHGIDRCQLVGYSLGARTGLALTLRRPDLVHASLLIGAHPGLASAVERQQRRTADMRWRNLLQTDGIASFVEQWQALPIFAGQSDDAREQQRVVRLSHDPNALAASLAHMGLAEMPDYRSAFGSAETPMHVAVGERDRKFYDLARSLVKTPIRIGASGHNAVADQPEAVARLISTLMLNRS